MRDFHWRGLSGRDVTNGNSVLLTLITEDDAIGVAALLDGCHEKTSPCQPHTSPICVTKLLTTGVAVWCQGLRQLYVSP